MGTGFGDEAAKGVRFDHELAGDEGRLSAHFERAYQAQFLSAFDLDTKETSIVDSGSSDLFHGPTCTVGGAF